MKHINRIQLGIANLEYNSPADCIELRLFLLSLMREFVQQYRYVQGNKKTQILKVFRELENLYKSFTAVTHEEGRNYKAQFEFAKALIADQVERTAPAFEMSNMAVA